mmetsp:Transcript_27611/g.57172  ORF Transcript_27611/g.57172 Transcript_27611/m.57172 type:complete len:265 (-) Transcript_27611:30-824(-)
MLPRFRSFAVLLLEQVFLLRFVTSHFNCYRALFVDLFYDGLSLILPVGGLLSPHLFVDKDRRTGLSKLFVELLLAAFHERLSGPPKLSDPGSDSGGGGGPVVEVVAVFVVVVVVVGRRQDGGLLGGTGRGAQKGQVFGIHVLAAFQNRGIVRLSTRKIQSISRLLLLVVVVEKYAGHFRDEGTGCNRGCVGAFLAFRQAEAVVVVGVIIVIVVALVCNTVAVSHGETRLCWIVLVLLLVELPEMFAEGCCRFWDAVAPVVSGGR